MGGTTITKKKAQDIYDYMARYPKAFKNDAAKLFGVSNSSVSNITNKPKNYGLSGPSVPRKRSSAGRKIQVSPETATQIYHDRKAGLSHKKIVAKWGTSSGTVSTIMAEPIKYGVNRVSRPAGRSKSVKEQGNGLDIQAKIQELADEISNSFDALKAENKELKAFRHAVHKALN